MGADLRRLGVVTSRAAGFLTLGGRRLGTARWTEQLGFWRKILAHPAYDAFWRDQAVPARLLEAHDKHFDLAVLRVDVGSSPLPSEALDALDWRQLHKLWVISNVPATLMVLGFLNRRVRAVGPVVLIFTLLVVAGAITALGERAGLDQLLRPLRLTPRDVEPALGRLDRRLRRASRVLERCGASC